MTPPNALPLPDSPADWPAPVRRYLAHLAVQKLLELHEGWYGLTEYLMRGRTTKDGEVIRWSAGVRDIWPTLVSEAEAFEAERKTKTISKPTETL